MAEKKQSTFAKGGAPGTMHNAEEFSNYVHAVSIPMKVVMAAIVIFFAGVIAFFTFGSVPVYTDAVAVSDSSCVCYVSADNRDGIEPGDRVDINGTTYTISSVSSQAMCVDDTFDEYARTLGDFTVGDYVFSISVDGDVPQGIFAASIAKDYLHPLSVLLGS